MPLRPGIQEFIDAARARGLTLAIATTTSMPNIEALLTSALGAQWREIFPGGRGRGHGEEEEARAGCL